MIYGYCRVSTVQQATDGESLGVQERTINGCAMMLGEDAPTIFIERGVSGAQPFRLRPEGSKLFALLEPGDVIIAAKFDRMFRNARDALNTLHWCIENKITLHVMDLGGDVINSPFSKFMFTLIAGLAEMVRDGICDNVRATKRDQAKRGRFLGGSVPFGYRSDSNGFLVEDIFHMDALKRARKMNKEGLSPRKISSKLKDEGITVSHETLRVAMAKLAA